MDPNTIISDIVEILRDIFPGIGELLFTLLTETLNIAPAWADGIIMAIGAGVLATFVLLSLILTIWTERKISARMQDRIGPNRVGPWGIFQTIADLGKLLTKEIIVPAGADLIPFMLAPVIAVSSVVLIWAVVPFTPTTIGTDLNVGVMYFAAVSSLGLVAILMAGWSSNNKYAILGAFRAVAMLVSYEVPLFIALLIPVVLTGSMRMNAIVEAQHIAYIIMMPVAGLIFWIATIAEVGRQPFDVLEAESEIVSGYNIEYGGFAFAMFYAAEWAHGFTICALMVVLFLGGWRGPFVEQIPTLGLFYFLIKTIIVYLLQMWIRFTVPRLRLDHIMDLCWKFLVPVLLGLFVVSLVADKVAAQFIPDYLAYLTATDLLWYEEILAALPRTGVLLATNLVVGAIALAYATGFSRRERTRIASMRMDDIETQTGRPLAPIESGLD